jgi:hypothetical protein
VVFSGVVRFWALIRKAIAKLPVTVAGATKMQIRDADPSEAYLSSQQGQMSRGKRLCGYQKGPSGD